VQAVLDLVFGKVAVKMEICPHTIEALLFRVNNDIHGTNFFFHLSYHSFSDMLTMIVAVDQTFQVQGHVRNARQFFIQLYDGSTSHTVQLVLSAQELHRIKTQEPPLLISTTITAQVIPRLSKGKGQKWDFLVVDNSLRVIGYVFVINHVMSLCRITMSYHYVVSL
jgi:hypothetical protein